MTAATLPALILGGHATAIPVARSLGGAGVTVHAVGGRHDPVRYSRHCTEYADLGDGEGVQERWLEWLKHDAERAVILPCADDGLELLARNRPILAQLGHRPVEANDDALLAMLDKDRTYELADEIGVDAPRRIAVRDRSDIAAAREALPYPCALKPLHSHLFARRSGSRAKLLVARSPAELESSLERMLDLGLEMMATEIIQGGDDRLVTYYSYLDPGGEPLFHFTLRKLRQFPVHFGIGCYRVAEWNPEVAELGLRFMQGVGLRGLAATEFKRDARDGRLKLIECNARFTGAIELLRCSGIDLPLFAYNQVLGRPGPPLPSYRSGRCLWDPGKDSRAFLRYRHGGEITLARWLRSLLRRQHFPVFSREDPGPTIAEHVRVVARAASMLIGRRDRMTAARSGPVPRRC